MTFLVIDHMVTCPKCKLVIKDLIKAHFLGGATQNPLAVYFRMIDPIVRGNFWSTGPYPVAVSGRISAKFVSAVPQVHVPRAGRTVYIARMRYSGRQVFESTSYFMQYLFTRIGHDFQPPLVSSITSRYNKEVIETAQRLLGMRR